MKNSDFVERFIEICGTSQPGIVSQRLDISYQTAKNYLGGRVPGSKALVYISKKTSCSIHWLLTGKGKKFIEIEPFENKPTVTDEMRAFIRQECLEVINEILRGSYEHLAAQKIVYLNSDNIKEEKVEEEKTILIPPNSI